MKKLVLYSFLLFFVATLSTCKKFPENRFWGKPKHYWPIGKFISEFKINGVDSMEALNYHYRQDYYLSNPNAPDDVRKLEFSCIRDKNSGFFYISFEPARFGTGHYGWRPDYKTIFIGFSSGLRFCRLLFPPSGTWDVIRFDKKGVKKYKTIYNGNTYEVTYKDI